MTTRIKNGKLILPQGIIGSSYLYYEGNQITHITDKELPFDRELDAAGAYVSAGFIDTHVHGGDGYEFIDATEDAILHAANIHGRHGTTTIFPTLSAFDYCTTKTALNAIQNFIQDKNLKQETIPNIPGVHLEGPYFSPKQSGAQDTTYIRNPDPSEYESLVNQFGDIIKRWSYAPETEGAIKFQDFLQQNNIVGSAGHTDAEIDHMEEAMDHGLSLITHLYSCTSTIVRKGGFRHLGVIESAWLYDDLNVETIADGCHLPPKLLQMIYKIKGPDHMMLTTDAIRYGGRSDCDTVTSGTERIPYIIEDGVAKLADRSAFAGSIATADVLVRTCVKKAGIPLSCAVRMITETPARIMGLSTKGKLQSGYDADVVIFDEDIQIKNVIVGGNVMMPGSKHSVFYVQTSA